MVLDDKHEAGVQGASPPPATPPHPRMAGDTPTPPSKRGTVAVLALKPLCVVDADGTQHNYKPSQTVPKRGERGFRTIPADQFNLDRAMFEAYRASGHVEEVK